MRLSNIKRILKEDLAKGGEALPKWMDAFLQPLNVFIENVGLALQNRLTFSDNFYCKEITLKFSSGVEQEVNVKTAFAPSSRAYGAFLINTANENATLKWNQKNNGNIGVTVTFTTAPEALCTLIVLLR